MKRTTGIFLLVIGAVLVLASLGGIIIIIVAVDEGKNRAVALVVCGILALPGILLLLIGIGVMSRQHRSVAPTKPVEGRVGKYLADKVETRTARRSRIRSPLSDTGQGKTRPAVVARYSRASRHADYPSVH